MPTRYIGTKMVPLTHELATEFATMDTFAGERPVSKKRSAFLRGRIESKQFYSPRWAIAWMNGHKIRVNGQHSSKALADSNGSFPNGLQAIVDEFECADTNELAELFAQFDPRASTRSPCDIVGAHQKTLPGVASLCTSLVDRLLSGVAFHLTGGYTEGVRPEPDERGRLLRQYEPFVKTFCPLVTTRHVAGRLGVHAAMFATWAASKSESFTFWNLVVTETHPDADHPTRTLGKWLRESCIAKEHWTPRAVYSKSIHAWTAFRKGHATNLRYSPKAPLPIAA